VAWSKKLDDVILEDDETAYQDPYADADKDESLSSLQSQDTSEKPIHKRTRMSKQKGRLQVQKHPCYPRESLSDHLHDLREREFKTDRLRQRYDVRNKDPKEISNIFIRAHVIQLKKRTEEGKLESGMKETFG